MSAAASAEALVGKLRALGLREAPRRGPGGGAEDADADEHDIDGLHGDLEPADLGFWADNAQRPVAGFVHWVCHALGPEHSLQKSLTSQERRALREARERGQELLAGRELDLALASLHREQAQTRSAPGDAAAPGAGLGGNVQHSQRAKRSSEDKIARLRRRKRVVEGLVAEKTRARVAAEKRAGCARQRRARAAESLAEVNGAINEALQDLVAQARSALQDLRGAEHGPHLWQALNQAQRRPELRKVLDPEAIASSVSQRTQELVQVAGTAPDGDAEARAFAVTYAQTRYAETLAQIEVASLRAQVEACKGGDRECCRGETPSPLVLAKILARVRGVSALLAKASAEVLVGSRADTGSTLEKCAAGATACLQVLATLGESLRTLEDGLDLERTNLERKFRALESVANVTRPLGREDIEINNRFLLSPPRTKTFDQDGAAREEARERVSLPNLAPPKELTVILDRIERETQQLCAHESEIAKLADAVASRLNEIDRDSATAQAEAVQVRQRLAALQAAPLPPDRNAWIANQLLSR